ncbi:MAG: hypothetical protein K2M87_03230 [Muribaculaceae bacterium]|nr:hypothetical protein [Muribaculaceae bacterium]
MNTEMRTMRFIIISIIAIATQLLFSCVTGIGDKRDHNLEKALLERTNASAQYIGKSNIYQLDEDRLEAVIIYYKSDSDGKRTEYNAKVKTNSDCSTIYEWEDLNSQVLTDTKHKFKDKLEEKVLNTDGKHIKANEKIKRN